MTQNFGRYIYTLVLLGGVLSCATAPVKQSASERQSRLNNAKSRAAALVAAGEMDEAVSILLQLTQEASGDYQVFVMLGDAYRAQGRVDEAVANYESALRISYESYEPHLKLATLLMDNEKTGRALTEFELATKYGERSALAHSNYGLALYKMGDKERAVEQLRIATELEPDNADYSAALGMGLTGIDDDRATDAFARAVVLGADSPGFHNNFGIALRRSGRLAEAERQFLDANEADESNEEYRFNLASLRTSMGKFAEASDQWRSLVEEHGLNWSYRVYLARCDLEMGDFGSARDLLAEIAAGFDTGGLRLGPTVDRIPPDLGDAFEIVALAHRGLKNSGAAMAAILRAVEHAPRRVSVLVNYGVILAESGMIAEARAQWEKALKIDPDNATARENLSAVGR